MRDFGSMNPVGEISPAKNFGALTERTLPSCGSHRVPYLEKAGLAILLSCAVPGMGLAALPGIGTSAVVGAVAASRDAIVYNVAKRALGKGVKEAQIVIPMKVIEKKLLSAGTYEERMLRFNGVDHVLADNAIWNKHRSKVLSKIDELQTAALRQPSGKTLSQRCLPTIAADAQPQKSLMELQDETFGTHSVFLAAAIRSDEAMLAELRRVVAEKIAPLVSSKQNPSSPYHWAHVWRTMKDLNIVLPNMSNNGFGMMISAMLGQKVKPQAVAINGDYTQLRNMKRPYWLWDESNRQADRNICTEIAKLLQPFKQS